MDNIPSTCNCAHTDTQVIKEPSQDHQTAEHKVYWFASYD